MVSQCSLLMTIVHLPAAGKVLKSKKNKLAFQECFIVPVGAANLCHHTLEGIINKKYVALKLRVTTPLP